MREFQRQTLPAVLTLSPAHVIGWLLLHLTRWAPTYWVFSWSSTSLSHCTANSWKELQAIPHIGISEGSCNFVRLLQSQISFTEYHLVLIATATPWSFGSDPTKLFLLSKRPISKAGGTSCRITQRYSDLRVSPFLGHSSASLTRLAHFTYDPLVCLAPCLCFTWVAPKIWQHTSSMPNHAYLTNHGAFWRVNTQTL